MKLLIASQIDGDALTRLGTQHDVVTAFGASEERLSQLVSDREALIFRSGVDISRAVLEAAPGLRLLIRAGSGLDNLDLAYTAQRGIALERIPGPGAQSVAELTFGLMLAVARRIVVADSLLRQGRWAKSEMIGRLLTGKTLGVVGVGSIGSHVARLGVAWGMSVIGCVAHPSPKRAAAFEVAGIDLVDYHSVLANADFVTLHVPLSNATHNLVDADAIARMKRGAFLINVARGGVVDERALLEDLTAGDHLAGAALDVHEAEGEGKVSPLSKLPNVVLTPHIGASTVDSQWQIGQEIIRIVDEYAGGGHVDGR
jgi:D-3-phosphoglycerate dehydrogenase / 2-oxoglutarate reductase